MNADHLYELRVAILASDLALFLASIILLAVLLACGGLLIEAYNAVRAWWRRPAPPRSCATPRSRRNTR